LERVRPGSIKLSAICDLKKEIADRLANETEPLLGYRPVVFASAEEALKARPEIQAVDVVVENRFHDLVVIPLLEAGLDVSVEKPLASTIARGKTMIATAQSANRILAVAENNRRDPMIRLSREVVRSDLIGTPRMVIEIGIGTGDTIRASRWRHSWANGGLAMDIGIHDAYGLETIVGPIQRFFTRSQQAHQERKEGETIVPVESDDIFISNLQFENGALGTWSLNFGAAASGQRQTTVYGEKGTIHVPAARSGKPVRVELNNETLQGDSLLAVLPQYQLNEIETGLFGERPTSYDCGAMTDRKLIAAEMSNFVDSVRTRVQPEVTAELGLRSVALIYALMESTHTENEVSVQDVLDGKARRFQDEMVEPSS
jgi:predicted dehydrogenase